jgi:glycosyltransferase XagB
VRERGDVERASARAGARLGAGKPPDTAAWLADYAFLINGSADAEALLEAHTLAAAWGVTFQAALFAGTHITEHAYAAAFAAAHGFQAAHLDFFLDPAAAATLRSPARGGIATPMPGLWRGTQVTLVCVTDVALPMAWDRIARARRLPHPILIVTRRALLSAFEYERSGVHIRSATHGLKRRLPEFSAVYGAVPWQTNAVAVLLGFLAGGFIAYPPAAIVALAWLLAAAFFGVVLVRLAALAGVWRRQAEAAPVPRIRDADLPVYSIMVALYDEVQVLPRLVAALSKLDYPPAKLDCMLVIEDVDTATKLALLDLPLPSFMRVVIVPEGQPQTKPRALNYALRLAKGDYVVIYDAEDRPEPDQLRRALAAFAQHGPDIACVQSCLNIYNARQSWLTRQFTVEYSALFDCILPALQWMRLPLPLGGTSNHFPRARLIEMHGWDPYNVTEDADLGIRIARLGYRTATIASTTWEEAPATLRLWRNQRTRWIKGWMQTYVVHTRQPLDMLRDIGLLRTLGFHLYMGGLVLSAIVHPLFYVSLSLEYGFGVRWDFLQTDLGAAFWFLALGNLLLGYLSSILVGVVAVRRRGHRLTVSALMMPLYWLLISFAAYRALWQLYREPFRWEKTPHGLAIEDEVD